MFLWRNDPRIYTWCRQFEPIDWASHVAWFESLHKRTDVKMFLIIKNSDAVGVCGLTSIDFVNSHAEFSLYIDPKRQGEGLGSEALAELVKYGFERLNLNHIFGETFDGNPAAKMFEACGFVHNGTRPQYYFRHGKYIDAHLYSILRG